MRHETENITDETGNAALNGAAPESRGETEFEAELRARYERLSLLTLDLAEEAGEAAVSFSVVEKGDKTGRFERRIAAMTRCIWAHKEIERLRCGGGKRLSSPILHGGSPAKRGWGSSDPRLEFDSEGTPSVRFADTSPMNGGGIESPPPVTTGKLEKRDAKEVSPNLTAESQITDDALAEDAYDPGYEIIYDGPAGGADFDVSAYNGAAIFEDDEIDEARLEKAIRQALRDGKRGEEALKAALGIGDEESAETRAPP